VAVRTQGALWAADASALYVCAVEIESTLIHRVAGRPGDRTALITNRPFPAPHHTISDVELIGVGHIPMPGEVPLAHHGMLLLGELPELRRHVLESLRYPIEKGFTTIEPRHR
jgi:magnesium chelatase family protein